MRRTICLIILLFSFISCSKDAKVIRRISGQWEIVKYSQTDASSITKPMDASGTFNFDKYKQSDVSGSYYYEYQFGDTYQSMIKSSGFYHSNYKDEALYLKPIETDSLSLLTFQKFHIDILTSTDAILEFNDLEFIHRFVLKKKTT